MDSTNIVEKYGHARAIPPAAETVPADRWDNIIREWGVVYACEWFGHHRSSDFTRDTITELLDRSAKSPAPQP